MGARGCGGEAGAGGVGEDLVERGKGGKIIEGEDAGGDSGGIRGGSMRWMAAVLLAAMTGSAWGAPKAEIAAIAEREYPALEKIYIGVHTAPELSLMEE